MKVYFLLIIGLLSIVACKDKEQVAVNTNSTASSVQGSGDLKDFTIIDIEGSKFKKATKKDENGHAVEEGYVLDGKKSGSWYNYYTDGRVMAIRNFVDGKVEGIYITIDDRGRIVQQSEYKNNYLDGFATLYKIGSRKMKETFYKAGKREGIEKEYFEMGPVQKETSYKNDILDGKMRFYNDKAELIAEYEYKNGEKISGGALKVEGSPVETPSPVESTK